MKQKHYLVIDGDTLSRESLNQIIIDMNTSARLINAGSIVEALEQSQNPACIEQVIIKIDHLDTDPVVLIANATAQFSAAKLLVLTLNNNLSFIHSLTQAGADNVINSGSSRESIVDEIRAMTQDTVAKPLCPEPANSGVGKLTQRQQQVMAYIMQGQANKYIAWKLGVSEGTIKLHVSSILRAMRATNRTQAAIKYRQLFGINGGLTQ